MSKPNADEVSISEAIALFDHSESARGAKGGVGKWPQRVLEKLKFLHDVELISYAALPATAIGGWNGHRLALSPAYVQNLRAKERLPFVSLILVHEGVHAVNLLGKELVYDEMMGRKLSIYYFRELSGPGVVNTLTGERFGIGSSHVFDQFFEMSDYLNKDQLVDYVLDIPRSCRQHQAMAEVNWLRSGSLTPPASWAFAELRRESRC